VAAIVPTHPFPPKIILDLKFTIITWGGGILASIILLFLLIALGTVAVGADTSVIAVAAVPWPGYMMACVIIIDAMRRGVTKRRALAQKLQRP